MCNEWKCYQGMYVPLFCDNNILHQEDPAETGHCPWSLGSTNPGGKGFHKTMRMFVSSQFHNNCNNSSFRKEMYNCGSRKHNMLISFQIKSQILESSWWIQVPCVLWELVYLVFLKIWAVFSIEPLRNKTHHRL